MTGKELKVYKNPNNDPKGPWRSIPLTAQSGHATPDQFYEIVSPTGKKFRPSKGRCWAVSQETLAKLREEGRLYFGKTGNSQPNSIRYLSEVEGLVPWTWWPHEEVGHTDEAKKEMMAIFPQAESFPTPKPVRLMERIIGIATNAVDLVLDSFAGSGTTAHAVLKLNAQDGRNRRVILVEMDAAIARPVTAERVRRISQGYTNAKGESIPGLGGEFRYCTLGSPLFRGNGSLNEDLTPVTLARHLYFTEFGEPPSTPPPPNGGLIGTFGDTALHLLWDADGPGFLDATTLRALPPWEGEHVIYGEGCAVPASVLQDHRVSFRQIPYRVRG